MTVAELIKELMDVPMDAPVEIAVLNGDGCGNYFKAHDVNYYDDGSVAIAWRADKLLGNINIKFDGEER